jgi:hypothetical protein
MSRLPPRQLEDDEWDYEYSSTETEVEILANRAVSQCC